MNALKTASKALGVAQDILGELPPEAVPLFFDLLAALRGGDSAKAERLARLTAGTLAAKEVIKRRFRK